MTNKEVFEHFEKLHSYSFATIDDGYPEVRIAHFITYDDDGIYFQTMRVKPFYKQLKDTKRVAVISLVADGGKVIENDEGLSDFPPGYFIKLKGDVKEISFHELEEKAKKDSRFTSLVKDIERYPTMTTFVINKYNGEIFDYDFELANRPNKIERTRFSFNGMDIKKAGFTIDRNKCISCGACEKVCTFKAIEKVDGKYHIIGKYCDECGSCYSVCPVHAVIPKCEMREEDRNDCNKILRKLYF